MIEERRYIPGFDRAYSISNFGIVKSHARSVRVVNQYGAERIMNVPDKIMNQCLDKGYYRVSLTKDRSSKKYPVHRLILISFLGESKKYACHKDGNSTNNRLDNLYWGTASENVRDSVRHGTFHQTRKTHCLRGHVLSGDNLELSQLKRNKRSCRICHKASRTRSRLKIENINTKLMTLG